MNRTDYINKLAKEEQTTPDELIENLIDEALEYRTIMRIGGAVMTLPNPQIFKIEPDAADEAINALRDAKSRIKKVQSKIGNYSIPLGDIANFLEHKIFYDSERDRKEYIARILEAQEFETDSDGYWKNRGYCSSIGNILQ